MKNEYSIKKELKRLRSIHGAGTELISVYVPPGFPISEEIAKLRNEYGQASNIKSKTTRLNVQGALEKIIQHIKLYRATPKNGLAVFCGNISNNQSKPNIELFAFETPQPIKSNIYRCESTFLLEPIDEMLESKELYALLVMDGREATVGVLKGSSFTVDKKLKSFAHSKMSKGGQSAARFQRAIEESIGDYHKRIADTIDSLFAKYNFKIGGLVVGGPGPTKENFVKAKLLNYQIKVLGVFDTGYTDEHMGVDELLEHARDLLEEQEVMQKRRVMEKFKGAIANSGLATYGYEGVKKAMLNNSVATLIISEDLELYEVKYNCNTCQEEFTKLEQGNERQLKHSDGGVLTIVEQKDAIEGLIEIADRNGVDVVFISSDNQYGRELLLGFGGVAALLRYK